MTWPDILAVNIEPMLYGIKPAVKMYYQKALDRRYAFRTIFHRKILQLVKTLSTHRGIVDSDRILNDLEYIADQCKERGYGARKYLKIITAYANSAVTGKHHAEKQLDRDTLELK